MFAFFIFVSPSDKIQKSIFMKLNSFALLVITTVIGFMVADSYNNVGYTNPTGAPAAACGSIGHPATCAQSGCHVGGTNTIQTGWITSTIPVSGYVPGTTYTITATATSAGISTFGFEISSENSVGLKKGTLIITNTGTTKLIGSGVYITHTSGGISGTANSHTWSFNWTAPAAATGNVTFFGSFLLANGNTTQTGDETNKSSLLVHEDMTTGITDNSIAASVISVYPNPVSKSFNVSYRVARESKVEVKLYDVQGRMIAPLMSEIKTPGDYQNSFKIPFNLNSGVCFLEIATETSNTVKKILVQQ